ncbi:hypothetical protein [Kitasatospora sp. NBC_00458]|uniref:hypothetical protein n=1 Tax=Kitasatospora sp. NBC_00458 TaxID=2903568 RepID=UPI002E183F93
MTTGTGTPDPRGGSARPPAPPTPAPPTPAPSAPAPPTAALRIPAADLHRALDVLVRHLAERLPDDGITVRDDYYWSVPPAKAADVHADPPELTIGQVTEAWAHLEKMAKGETPAVGYGFVWLGDVLRAIGAEAL